MTRGEKYEGGLVLPDVNKERLEHHSHSCCRTNLNAVLKRNYLLNTPVDNGVWRSEPKK